MDLRSAPRGEKVAAAKVQDCDLSAEFIRLKDQLKPKRRNKTRVMSRITDLMSSEL